MCTFVLVVAAGWPGTFIFCPLYVFVHFSSSFCTALCALDLARDHAPQKCPVVVVVVVAVVRIARVIVALVIMRAEKREVDQ